MVLIINSIDFLYFRKEAQKMKDWIVLVAAIVLGVILYGFILGDSNSLKTESQSIMTEVQTQLNKVHP